MTTEDRAQDQAQAQYQSIVGMLDAYNLDWNRLGELIELKAEAVELGNDDGHDGLIMTVAEMDEMDELIRIADGCEDQDDALERINEDPLSVEVRSDWTSIGKTLEPAEYMILLCTGGPAVRIIGELDQYGCPDRAWLEYQDWGTPWTRWYGASSNVLVEYSRFFLA
jgi:hypothetical protein